MACTSTTPTGKPATQQLNYSGDNRDFWGTAKNATYNPATNAIIPVLANTSKGYSLTTSVGLTLNPWHGLTGTLAYTYTNAKDISGNPGSSASSAWSNNYSVNDPNELLMGYSQYSVPHRIVGSLSYRKEYLGHLATTVSSSIRDRTRDVLLILIATISMPTV